MAYDYFMTIYCRIQSTATFIFWLTLFIIDAHRYHLLSTVLILSLPVV